MKTAINAVLLAVVVAAGGGVLWQRIQAKELRQALDSARTLNQQLRTEAARVRLAQMNALRAAESEALRSARVQTNVAANDHAPGTVNRAARVPIMANPASRDPEKDLVRLEHFQNAGQATPSAAFETLIWAVTTGHDEALTPLFGVSPAGRTKLQAYLDGLSAESREKFRQPEQVIGVLAAMDFLRNEALQIMETKFDDADHAVLVVRRLAHGTVQSDKKIPMERASAGWRVPITDAMVDAIPKALAQASLYVAPLTK